ncbi:ABC transporter permease [Roseibium aquae]|uniref:ABC transporter permease n=1 Tax=Roseibium aquae TaxID=1323746 RepID=A0A916WXX3_9HYPH|nr:energy-coupling factor transporter transmembrane protein EcfT [Roseibium aquae]GGB41042.1 ABC transporter permease [Roseibium aquae]
MIATYIPGASWLHRCPAGLKLIALLVVSIVVFPLTNLWMLTIGLIGVAACYAPFGRDAFVQFKRLKPIALMLAFLFGFHIYLGTWTEGLAVLIRIVTLVLMANLVSLTTRLDDMIAAVEPLFRPLKLFGVPPQRPALAIALVLRFVPVLMSIHEGLAESYQARSGRRRSWRLIAPLALQALAISDHVAESLAARGGSSGLADTRMRR